MPTDGDPATGRGGAEPPELDGGPGALDEASARAINVIAAGAAIPALGPGSYLHAGPPVELGEMVDPMRAALAGALVFEGEAGSIVEAEEILRAGELKLTPCHHVGAVGAMAGIVSAHMPVVVVAGEHGRRTFAPLNEGLGEALRFGSTAPRVLERLAWMRDILAPILDAALQALGGIDIVAMQAEGLRRGDECHNRNVASTAALVLALAPTIARIAPSAEAGAVLEFMGANPHTFLSFSMAAAKAIADAGQESCDPGVVSAIAANGVRVGVRVTGTEQRWFTAPAPLGSPKLFDSFTMRDACPMMGDSFVTETVGLGAFAASAAPAIAAFVGGTPAEGAARVAEMRRICRWQSTRMLIPAEGFRGSPLGIDVRAVREQGLAPVVNNGVAHRIGGRGQVGAGLTRLPLEPFLQAAAALDAMPARSPA